MKKNAKKTIANAAITLFNTNGFSGTSIRDICELANVNNAAIAYYFQNKQGLLEYCFTSFFEKYVYILEEAFEQIEEIGALECLKEACANLMHYQSENNKLANVVYREMSMDSQMVREIMATYYHKEKFYFQKIFEKGFEKNEFRPQSIPYLIIQLKGLLMMPFMNAHYIREVLYIFPGEPFFEQKYIKEINTWIENTLCKEKIIKKKTMIK